MTLFLMDVMDLKVFDEQGKFITKLDKATKGKLVHDEINGSYFGINIVDFNIDLLKALGEVVESDQKSDFDKELSIKSTKIKFKSAYNSKNYKRLKLIAEGYLRNEDGDIVNSFKIIIKKSRLVSGFGLDAEVNTVSEFSHTFVIEEDKDGDRFELELFDN